MQNHVGYSFQCFVSMILGECNFKDDICYPDDILLWDSTVNMEAVLDRSENVNLDCIILSRTGQFSVETLWGHDTYFGS